MRKKSLLAALMASILLLSGCALIVKDEAVDNATVIIRMGDQVITKEKVKEEVQSELDNMAYLYSMYGYSYDTTDADNIAAAQEEAIESLKKDLALSAKATELGLDQLTEEEEETVRTAAQENLDSASDYVKQYMLDDTEDMDEDALAQAVSEKLTELGVSLDTYLETQRKSMIDDKLRAYAIKDVTVTDEEIQEEYDQLVETDKDTYAEDTASWVSAANNGTTLYYTPAGIRRVKQILTKFKDEDQTVIDEAKQQVTDATTAQTAAQAKIDAANETLALEDLSDEDKAQAEADLAAATQELADAETALTAANEAVDAATETAFANLDEDVDALLAKLDEEGADWQALMDEYNQDPGMESNEKGYAISADMTGFDPAFVEAAMALANPGDHSGKIRGTSYGYYIIRYESDETEGAIPLEDVKASISDSLLSSKQDDAYDAAVEQWVEEAGITVDLNALKD